MLDRVKVMRIFDVAGLIEAVAEITEICEKVAGLASMKEPLFEDAKRVVADSEDESEGDDGAGSIVHGAEACKGTSSSKSFRTRPGCDRESVM